MSGLRSSRTKAAVRISRAIHRVPLGYIGSAPLGRGDRVLGAMPCGTLKMSRDQRTRRET